MLRHLIIAWGVVAGTAAIYTGFHYPHSFFVCMTGLMPPHYGYSAYAMIPLVFLGPKWMRCAAAVALLLSGNRASWVGVIAGGAWRLARGPHSAAVLLIALATAATATIGGIYLKPLGVQNDVVRVRIWRAAIKEAIKHPEGMGRGNFITAVDGRVTRYAHSDVLQRLVERGWVETAALLLMLGWLFFILPDSPEKAVVVALTAVSVIDNRLHHPASVALYWAVLVAAALEPGAGEIRRQES